ncbi:hypothetical protein ACHAPJ_011687 [Fusarium lateritium]
MAKTKRALLIGSTYNDLKGPQNDVEAMATVLEKWEFKDITKCVGKDATYDGILNAWKELINKTSSEDAVVIFYAGHGGLVEDSAKSPDYSTPARYQFIVPVDYNAPTKNDDAAPFNGILDVQMSHLLHETTKRTHNVTTIFDCCHSGGMARDPVHPDLAQVRSVGKVKHRDVTKRVADLRRNKSIPSSDGKLDAEGNKLAVRIAASQSSLPAWENSGSNGWAGSMTKALSQALTEALGSKDTGMASWKTIMTLVRERVKADFPQQHPHVDGPSVRRLFSLGESNSTSFVLKMVGNDPTLEAGRVSGVHEGNVYSLMPHGSERLSKRAQLGRATATDVFGLFSLAELELFPGKGPIPDSGVLAFLEVEAFPKWPIAVPKDQKQLRRAIRRSKYIRAQAEDTGEIPVASIWQNGDDWILSSGGLSDDHSVRLLTLKTSEQEPISQLHDDLVQGADKLARAQHLLALVPDEDEELDHAVTFTMVQVEKKQSGRPIPIDGSGTVTDGDRVLILLRNDGAKLLYASIYNINVRGHISCVHSDKTTSIELLPGQIKALGAGLYGERYNEYKEGTPWPRGSSPDGIPVYWPEGIPRDQPIHDRLVVILTEERVDLGQLVSNRDNKASRGPDPSGASSLELLAYEIGSGKKRDFGQASQDRQCFAVIDVSLRLESKNISINDLPSIEDLPEGRSVTRQLPPVERDERGIISGVVRWAKGTPSQVWVVNNSNEDIQVVVSKYLPNRMLAGGGVNASATGGGINLDTTVLSRKTFVSPACKKTIPAQKEDQDPSYGIFPLWTRKEGFGVISILKKKSPDADWEVDIENDQIPIGTVAYYSGGPNLQIVKHK